MRATGTATTGWRAVAGPSGAADAVLAPSAPRAVAPPALTVVATLLWPQGTATPSEQCALCHAAIYREYATGFGADLQYRGMIAAASLQEPRLELPPDYAPTSTGHAYAGVDPWPIRA